MSNIEKTKTFNSVAASQKWLNSLVLQQGQQVKVTVTKKTTLDTDTSSRRKFSETKLCGLWKDRQDMDDVATYVRQLRKPRFSADVS